MDENSYFQIVQWICIMVLGALGFRHMLFWVFKFQEYIARFYIQISY
jgi:hypothetical protein